ncbi:uncharacterized protein L199_005373 [Kwoniella botswanensis]|uniref:uncharacterized protein n=1 Tax=Kwoniella botswanensis TaxID=1268659 RepID=UPI00315D7BE5
MSQVRMEDSTNKVEPPSDWFISLTDLRSSQITYLTLTQLLTSFEGKKDSKALINGGVVLGRKSSTAAPKDGRFDSPIISRAHAQLTLTPNGHVYVTDLGSMHGSSISSATQSTVPLTIHSPVQVIDGDTILLGKTVTSNGTNYDPLRLTVFFRHHEFGEGSTAHGGRKSIGKIKSELAQSKFAGVNDEPKLRKLIANLKPNHAGTRIASAAIIAAMAQDRIDLPAYLPSSSQESPLIQSPDGDDDNIDFNADDSVEFTFEIKSSQVRSGPGLSPESAIEVQSLRSQSPISVRSDTNDSDQENTAPEVIHRSNTYKIPPSILYISEEEDHDSLPRGSSDFDQHEADDDSMTDYEDHEDVAEAQGEEADIFPEKISTLSGMPYEDDQRYDDDSELENESENGEPEVMGVREDVVQPQPPLHSAPAKSPAPRPVDNNESINPDYRFNSPINVPIITSPLGGDDSIEDYDKDDVSRHSPPSSPNYRAWYSYSSDEEGDIPDPDLLMGGTLNIIDFAQSQAASLPSPVSPALTPMNATLVAVTAPKAQDQMQGEDEEDRYSDSQEDQEEEHEEEDFNEDQSMVENDENYSEEEAEDEGIQMEGYHHDGSSERYDDSNYDEDESERMDYSEDGRSSVYDSDGGQSYDEENEFYDEEEEEDDGEDEEEGDDDDEDGGSEREEEFERSEIDDDDDEDEDEVEDEDEKGEVSPIVNNIGTPHRPQIEVSVNVDSDIQTSQLGKMEPLEIALENDQPAQEAEHHEHALDRTGLSKEVKEEMLSQHNQQSSVAQDRLASLPTSARDVDEEIESNIGKDVDIETSSVEVVAGSEEAAAPTVSDGQLPVERPRTPCFSFSDASSEGPITPESTKKRPLPEDFTIVDHDHISEGGTTTSTDMLVPLQVRDATRPTKKIRRIGSAIGYMALGAALGGAGTVYGLMQFAP